MISHVGIGVENLKDSEFYILLLQEIGWRVIFRNEFCVALGKGNIPYFEIYVKEKASSPIHIAIDCMSKEEVNTFYNKAIQLNAKDNGKPGNRDYFPDYYSCYVIDPNGHNLEGLCFRK